MPDHYSPPPALHLPSNVERHSTFSQALDSLLLRIQATPPADALRLYLNRAAIGWVLPDIAIEIAGGSCDIQVEIRDEGLIMLCPEGFPAHCQTLGQLAKCLHLSGSLGYWRDELIDVIDDANEVVAHIERATARRLGLLTRAVHLNAYTQEGKVWIAQRALTKAIDPGLWDTLVGGLVSADENLEQALVRETAEEAGLSLQQIVQRRFAGAAQVMRLLPEGFQREWIDVVDCILPDGVVPANKDGEVAQIRQASRLEVLDGIAAGAFTVEAALALLISFISRGWIREHDRNQLLPIIKTHRPNPSKLS